MDLVWILETQLRGPALTNMTSSQLHTYLWKIHISTDMVHAVSSALPQGSFEMASSFEICWMLMSFLMDNLYTALSRFVIGMYWELGSGEEV